MALRGAVYVNGTIRPANEAVVPVYDHGFLYGEGVYETLRTYNRVPFLYDRHQARLRASANRIQLDVPFSDDQLAGWIDETVAQAGELNEAYIRILLTRGDFDVLIASEGAQGLRLIEESSGEGVVAHVHRGFPACIVMDPDEGPGGNVELCRVLKRDPFTAVVPIVFLFQEASHGQVHQALEAGADEVITDRMDATEQSLRLQVTLQRADRDVSVNPTTRLPGTAQIERDITDRIQGGTMFAVCYADLDHFKEFNDRYGYDRGDGVIQLLSRILRDIVKELSPSGFIGHIGGDDFIFTLPLDDMARCCEEIIEIFDELVPYQYSEADRKAGHFLGKDRRGNIYRIPMMTLSIGVVTSVALGFRSNSRQVFVRMEACELPGWARGWLRVFLALHAGVLAWWVWSLVARV